MIMITGLRGSLAVHCEVDYFWTLFSIICWWFESYHGIVDWGEEKGQKVSPVAFQIGPVQKFILRD